MAAVKLQGHPERSGENRRKQMKLKLKALTYAVVLSALPCGTLVAQVPPMTTIGQLATKEGMHPDYYDSALHLYNLAKDIPRDFPIPADSHQLQASNAMPFASVSGPTPQETESFYLRVFPLEGWSITKHFGFRGYTEFHACKGNQCVNLSCGTSEVVGEDGNRIKFQFFNADHETGK
jgi:hypothetical protein